MFANISNIIISMSCQITQRTGQNKICGRSCNSGFLSIDSILDHNKQHRTH